MLNFDSFNPGVNHFVRGNIAVNFELGAEDASDDLFFPGKNDFQEKLNIGSRFYL